MPNGCRALPSTSIGSFFICFLTRIGAGKALRVFAAVIRVNPRQSASGESSLLRQRGGQAGVGGGGQGEQAGLGVGRPVPALDEGANVVGAVALAAGQCVELLVGGGQTGAW